MGYKAVSAVLHHSKSSASTKLVFVAIAHFYDDLGDNGAFPSQETLAEMANCTIRTVQRAIRELHNLGELDILVHAGKGKTFDRQTNRYFIVLDCPESCDSSFNHKNLPDKNDTPTRQKRRTYPTKWSDLPDTDVVLTVKNKSITNQEVISETSPKLHLIK